MGYNAVYNTRRSIPVKMKKQILLRALLILPMLSFVFGLAFAPVTNAACGDRLLTLPPWYRGLVDQGSCSVKNPDDIGKFVQILALNIVEILLHIVAYVAIAFIIVGGFKYITSAGSPDGNQKGRKTIVNAVIGLLISIASIGIVNVVVNSATSGGGGSNGQPQQTQPVNT